MKPIILLALSTLLYLNGQANKVSGKVSDQSKQPLSFASITVKGTSKGTSANSLGYYSIDLTPGQYTLVIQHVGYKSIEQKVEVNKEDVSVDFVLELQQYNLGNVTVKSGDDPALAIIKNAISKRSFYEEENKRFEAMVYTKGRLQLRDFPKKIFGQKVDFEDGDTSKKKVIFLSETVSKYSVDNAKSKVEVISTKVSGQSDGFGFSSPQIVTFYKNNVSIASLNPRGFVSPIADNALNFYRYKFEGTFFENGKMINRIKVIPKRTYEPLFNGYINIIEEEWRIQSLQLTLYKENQIQVADTLVIEQLYVPVNNTWLIKQQTLFPAVKFLGFDGFGSFVQVYDDYNLSPVFAKGFFDNTVLKFYDSANKKPRAYWDSIRPIPLVDVEINDYRKKDSLEVARNDPRYLDSLDRKRNKPNYVALLTTGQTFGKEKKLSSVTIPGLLNTISYNTVEGLVVNFEPSYTKKWNKLKRDRLTVTPEIRYGFGNKRFNPSINVRYDYGKKYFSSISYTVGRKVFQFDNRNPISSYSNSINTLYWARNYLKIYEAFTQKIVFSKGLGEGLSATLSFEYQDREPLHNTTDYKWRDFKNRPFSPNISFTPHQASVATLQLRWQPGAKYIELPERKIMIGSAYPVLTASLTKGINNLFSSDVDYTKWRFGVSQQVNLQLAGRLDYNLSTGGFLSNKASFFPDYNHYIANRFASAAPYLQSFQLMNYFVYSNTSKVYAEGHTEYHLNGLLTNKIPGFKKLNWFLVTGSNLLYIDGGTLYGEVFLGLENILRVGRVDFVQSFTKNGWQTSGVRFTFAGIR